MQYLIKHLHGGQKNGRRYQTLSGLKEIEDELYEKMGE
jgi:poly(3-hydroxybutyrate) depolymerase